MCSDENASERQLPIEKGGGEGEEDEGKPGTSKLSAAQKEVLDRCLHALTNAKNDSHTLAALLLVRVTTTCL